MSATEYRHPGLTLEQRVKAYLDSPIGAPVTRGLVIDLMAELCAVRSGVVAEEPEWEYGYTSKWGTIAASRQADAETRAADHTRGIAEHRESGDLTYHGKVVKRIAGSKAGPWVEVTDA